MFEQLGKKIDTGIYTCSGYTIFVVFWCTLQVQQFVTNTCDLLQAVCDLLQAVSDEIYIQLLNRYRINLRDGFGEVCYLTGYIAGFLWDNLLWVWVKLKYYGFGLYYP